MAFRIAARKKGMSTVELGIEVNVQQKTAWFFERKLPIAMKPGRTGNIGLRQIEDFGKDTFEQAVDKITAKRAVITTDDFPSWVALKKDMRNIETKKSENGAAF